MTGRWFITPVVDRIINGERFADSIIVADYIAYGLKGAKYAQFLKVNPDGNLPFGHCLLWVDALDCTLIEAAAGVTSLPNAPLDVNLTDAQIAVMNVDAGKVGRAFLKRALPRQNTIRDAIRAIGFAIEPAFGKVIP